MNKVLFFIVVLFFALTTGSAQGLSLARIADTTEQVVAEELVKEIASVAGVKIKITAMPAQRGKAMALAGELDGEVARIFSYGVENPTLIRVPTPYSSLETVAFALKSRHLKIKNLKDLRSYRVAVQRGKQHTKDATEDVPSVLALDSTELCMDALLSNKVDVMLTSRIAGMEILRVMNESNIEPVGSLGEYPLYIYLTESNRKDVQVLDSAIKTLIASGRLKSLRAKLERAYKRFSLSQ